MKKLFIGMLGLLLSFSLFAEEVLYCSSDIATGFVNDDKTGWQTSGFKDIRFTMKVHGDFSSVEIGDFFYNCNVSDFSSDFISCEHKYHSGWSIRYSKKTNRFINIWSGLYGNILGNGGKETDSIYGGKCEKF